MLNEVVNVPPSLFFLRDYINEQLDLGSFKENYLNFKKFKEIFHNENFSIKEFRLSLLQLKCFHPHCESIVFKDRFLELPTGKIEYRIYEPSPFATSYPTVFFFPETFFMAREINFSHMICSQLVKIAGCQVIAIHYNLSPEHRFPTNLEIIGELFFHLIQNAPLFKIDVDRLICMGYGSGGNIASLISLVASQSQIPMMRQILVSPILDLSHHYQPSHLKDEFMNSLFFNRMVNFYVPSGYHEKMPDISPIFHNADVLSKQSPTTLIFGENDYFSEQSERYANLLESVKVPVNKIVYKNENHLLLWFNPMVMLKLADTVKHLFNPHAPILKARL